MAFSCDARGERAHAVARANLVILVFAMHDDRVVSVGLSDLPVGGTVSVRQSDRALFGAEEAFGCKNERVIKTAAYNEGCGHLYHLVMVRIPVSLQLL